MPPSNCQSSPCRPVRCPASPLPRREPLEQPLEPHLGVLKVERPDNRLVTIHRCGNVGALCDVDADVEHTPPSSRRVESPPSESEGITLPGDPAPDTILSIPHPPADRRDDSFLSCRTSGTHTPSAPFAPFILYSRPRIKKRDRCTRSGNINNGRTTTMKTAHERAARTPTSAPTPRSPRQHATRMSREPLPSKSSALPT